MANKTDEQANKLSEVGEVYKGALGALELSEESLKVLFPFAYVHLKYQQDCCPKHRREEGGL